MREKAFLEIIQKEVWLMDLLKIVRDLDLPDWYLAAGVVRNTVWDVLHGFEERTPLNDVDLVFFDSENKISEKEIESELRKVRPNYNWEVVNQANAHTFNEQRNPATSSCDAISYWSETATTIGIRLEKDGSLTICAPNGLNNLMELKLRKSPKTEMSLYQRRLLKKEWQKKWPKLQRV